ncbi:sigma-54 dependent transcriptional regulator [Cellulophaga sp. L1A9]|uniref:sigma-54-dependent transcriptional regulator n=1 Tax=Cellulophaga sp. L1A9 TaxID=2686362 RepID=UPI00131BF8DE|nr:sigma-54 dependent transcriptional regulator [Cellulophaga sp. L1A9]
MPRILIIEDDAAFCQMLQRFLEKKGYDAEASFTAEDAKKKFKAGDFDMVITDLRLPNYDGIELLSDIKAINSKIPVLVMTSYAEVSTAVNAMKKGAFDYISKPFTPEEMVMLVENALNQKPNQVEAVTESTTKQTEDKAAVTTSNGIKGISDASKKLHEYIKLVAPTDMSILITGESGTGKEVTAKSIHDASKRRDFNFVAVDCGAIPKEIATSEFFGHVKGSFTGAIEDKIGHFQAANGGTLFLDEIGNLSYENQIQLLRALQERKIKRVGSTKEVSVDVRVITATNEDLVEAVEKGTFREDLYHRINEFSIETPSLQERFEDLPLFADFFLDKANKSLDKRVLGFSDETTAVFKAYHWPGNLRELQNIIKRSVLLTTGDIIQTAVLPKELFEANKKVETENFSKDAYEKDQIIRALKETNFNKSKAAKLLKVTRKTLYNKINQYNLDL